METNTKLKIFFRNRLDWLKETLIWLGIILCIGFYRVNYGYDPELRLHFPEYISYDILGNAQAQVGKLSDYKSKK